MAGGGLAEHARRAGRSCARHGMALKCDRHVPRLFRDVFRELHKYGVSGCWLGIRIFRLTHACSWSSIAFMELGSVGGKASRKVFAKGFAKIFVGAFRGSCLASARIDDGRQPAARSLGKGSRSQRSNREGAFSKTAVEISPTCRSIAVRPTVRANRSRDSAVRLPVRNHRSRRAVHAASRAQVSTATVSCAPAHRCSHGEDVCSAST
jgi:hypothetical protein